MVGYPPNTSPHPKCGVTRSAEPIASAGPAPRDYVSKLRRLVDGMALDEAGVCGECRRAAGKTKDSSHPSQILNPAIIVCEERERLGVAYRDAMQAKLEFESRLDSEILSADPNVKRQANHGLKRAEKHYYRFMHELMAHEKSTVVARNRE